MAELNEAISFLTRTRLFNSTIHIVVCMHAVNASSHPHRDSSTSCQCHSPYIPGLQLTSQIDLQSVWRNEFFGFFLATRVPCGSTLVDTSESGIT